MIDKSTLVLNVGYLPLGSVHWSRAFSKVFQGKARVAEYYDLTVRSPTREFLVPAVIVCLEYSGYPVKKTYYNKRLVYERDNYICQYCGHQLPKMRATIDHVIPISRGGKNTFLNCVTACMPCNSRKRNRTPREAFMPLVKVPLKPHFNSLLLGLGPTEPEWYNYIPGAR